MRPLRSSLFAVHLLAAGLVAATVSTTTVAATAAEAPTPQVEQSQSEAGTKIRPRSARRPLAVARTRSTAPRPALDSSQSLITAPVTEVVETVPVTAPTTPTTAATGPYTLLNVDNGEPTRWNPCQPVPWQFNPTGAPAGGLTAIQSALATVSAKTGLQFRYEGPVATVPSARYLNQPWGSFRPLLIGWSTASESDLLAGGSASLVGMARILWTGSYDAQGNNHTQIASGVVALNRATTAGMTGPGSWYTFVLHELGHAVGLGHVDDAQQLMRATIPAHLGTYGSGDTAGLAVVGSRGGCLPDIR